MIAHLIMVTMIWLVPITASAQVGAPQSDQLHPGSSPQTADQLQPAPKEQLQPADKGAAASQSDVGTLQPAGNQEQIVGWLQQDLVVEGGEPLATTSNSTDSGLPLYFGGMLALSSGALVWFLIRRRKAD